MYLLMRVKSLMSLKVWSNLGLPKKISKSPHVGWFSVYHAKSRFHTKIRHFLYNFLEIYSKTRVSELESAAKSSKLSRANKCQIRSSSVRASEASSANERASARASESSRQASKPTKQAIKK